MNVLKSNLKENWAFVILGLLMLIFGVSPWLGMVTDNQWTLPGLLAGAGLCFITISFLESSVNQTLSDRIFRLIDRISRKSSSMIWIITWLITIKFFLLSIRFLNIFIQGVQNFWLGFFVLPVMIVLALLLVLNITIILAIGSRIKQE